MNVVAILGGGVWASLAVSHGIIIIYDSAGLLDSMIGQLFMLLLSGAFFLHVRQFWWLRAGRIRVGLMLASLLIGAGMLALEVTNHFSGYE